MKAKQNTNGLAIGQGTAKQVKFNAERARARGAVLLALGLVSPCEAGHARKAGMARPCGWSTSPAWRLPAIHRNTARGGETVAAYPAMSDRLAAAVADWRDLSARDDRARALGCAAAGVEFGAFCAALVPAADAPRVDAYFQARADARARGAHVEAARAARAGLLSAADVYAGGANERARAAMGARWVAERRAVLGNRAALARLHDIAAHAVEDELGAAVIDGRLTVFDARPASGSAGKDCNKSKRGAVKVWSPADIRAAALRLLRAGLVGRASARAARIGWAAGMRWLRRNSRREALALGEVGAAAGVDDLGAGLDWAGELMAIGQAHFQTAAALGAAMVAAPLAPCAAIVARGYSGGVCSDLRRAVLGRGRRCDGLPVAEWVGGGRGRKAGDTFKRRDGSAVAVREFSGTARRVVRPDSIAIVGRGCVWIWAARDAGRSMHAARYGRGGRDGREVPACWSANGSIAGAVAIDRRPVPTRRPSEVAAARAFLARAIREAREDLALARLLRDAAQSVEERQEAGGLVGRAVRTLKAAQARAKWLGRAMRGESLPDDLRASLIDSDGDKIALTVTGRSVAKRVRDDLAAMRGAAGVLRRPASRAPLTAGDECAPASDAQAAAVAAMVAAAGA